MKRSREFVEWHRQATDAQDPDRPETADDLDTVVVPPPVRFNPNHDTLGKFATTDGSSLGVAKDLVAEAKAKEPALTSRTTELAAEHGGTMQGLEWSVKSPDSLTRKIEEDVRESGGSLTPREAGSRLFDVNRYTTVLPEDKYAEGAQAMIDELRADGDKVKVKNYWGPETPYQGVNVQVTSADAATQWELQFHTGTSFDVKEGQMHAIYEKQRVEPDIGRWNEYAAQMHTVGATIPIPHGAGEVR